MPFIIFVACLCYPFNYSKINRKLSAKEIYTIAFTEALLELNDVEFIKTVINER